MQTSLENPVSKMQYCEIEAIFGFDNYALIIPVLPFRDKWHSQIINYSPAFTVQIIKDQLSGHFQGYTVFTCTSMRMIVRV